MFSVKRKEEPLKLGRTPMAVTLKLVSNLTHGFMELIT